MSNRTEPQGVESEERDAGTRSRCINMNEQWWRDEEGESVQKRRAAHDIDANIWASGGRSVAVVEKVERKG